MEELENLEDIEDIEETNKTSENNKTSEANKNIINNDLIENQLPIAPNHILEQPILCTDNKTDKTPTKIQIGV